MANEAFCIVTGYVATQPTRSIGKDGTQMIRMRVGWTPRVLDRTTGEWSDRPGSFITVWCYRKVAENAAFSLRKGDAVIVRGTLRIREYQDQSGSRRIAVEVLADTVGHDMSRGTSLFSRSPQHAEQTAAEHERSLLAAGARQPLPGDRTGSADDQALSAGFGSGFAHAAESEGEFPEDPGAGDVDVPGDDRDDSDGEFDSEDPAEDAEREPELVGAPS